MYRTTVLIIAALALGPQAAVAQKPSLQEGVVVSSVPGKATIVAAAKVTATVVAIDKATRTVTLKGPERTVDIVASDEVRNFDQIRLGDRVTVEYREALTLELKKTRTTAAPTETSVVARAKPGERPGGMVGREITALADVVAVDPQKSIISIKGPRGNVVDLKVQNPDQFKVVKKGDQIEVVYSEAIAVAVTPAPASGGKK
jgi:hypothetical protein